MGLYIDPASGSKEDWLKEHGQLVKNLQVFGPDASSQYEAIVGKGHLPVCLLNNRYFTAAGVAFSLQEFKAFLGGTDGRRHFWFTAPIEELAKLPGLASLGKKKQRSA